MSRLCLDCNLTWCDLQYAQWTPHGVCWRFSVWCVALSRGAHRPPIIRTAGLDGSRGFSSILRNLRGEGRSFWSIIKKRPRWNAAAPVALPETVSYTIITGFLFFYSWLILFLSFLIVSCNLAIFHYDTTQEILNCFHLHCPTLGSCILSHRDNVVLYNITKGRSL